jgi:protein TonB
LEPKVLRDIGFGTGKEAIHLIIKANNWSPGRPRGIPVKILITLPLGIQ